VKPPVVLYQAPKRARTDYRIGLAAWTDKSMLEESEFYPRRTMTAEERLWWYSQFFDTVEVNSSFYAIPSVDTTAGWVQRMPPGFLFNAKAYGLLTGHHVDIARAPEPLKRLLPAAARRRERGRVANEEIGAEARTWAFAEQRASLAPLRQAGKLGYVLFQQAPWVTRSESALADLARLPRELPDTVVAVEFRHRSWFGAHTDETLAFLRDHGLTYVSIDGPRSRATVPSLPALTTPHAVFRLHGRNVAGFLAQVQGKSPTVAEKYDYLYSDRELEEIARAAAALNGQAERVNLVMNNNRRDYPAINGMRLKEMLLEDWHPPDRETLIEELEARRARDKARRASVSAPAAARTSRRDPRRRGPGSAGRRASARRPPRRS
jgi:uncharacterized protein YecE (DUF72 family)